MPKLVISAAAVTLWLEGELWVRTPFCPEGCKAPDPGLFKLLAQFARPADPQAVLGGDDRPRAEDAASFILQLTAIGALVPVQEALVDTAELPLRTGLESRPTRRKAATGPLSPVLLLGGGAGEASCGLLFLASYLRRNGIEAFVRFREHAVDPGALRQSVGRLLERVRPRLVGVSLKWFAHIHRALAIAGLVKELDPDIQVVLGGNTAAHFWRELLAYEAVDAVILGDGELPLLRLCQGDPEPPNCAFCENGVLIRTPLSYSQNRENCRDSYLSHYDELFLSRLEQHSLHGWLTSGKGCSRQCLYCAGSREMQKTLFNRPAPFLRPPSLVTADISALRDSVTTFVYDFDDPLLAPDENYFERIWSSQELSRHNLFFYVWKAVSPDLLALAAETHCRVTAIIDVGCFSERQRKVLAGRGELKPCLTDRELHALLERCEEIPNLRVGIAGVAGLPFLDPLDLVAEQKFARRLLDYRCVAGVEHHLLQAQPGSRVSEAPERYGMVSPVRTFEDYRRWFAHDSSPGGGQMPLIRYPDRKVNRQIDFCHRELAELFEEKREQALGCLPERGRFAELRHTRLQVSAGITEYSCSLEAWLGRNPGAEDGGQALRVLKTGTRGLNKGGLIELREKTARAWPLEMNENAVQPRPRRLFDALFDGFSRPAELGAVYETVRAEHAILRTEFLELATLLNRLFFLELR